MILVGAWLQPQARDLDARHVSVCCLDSQSVSVQNCPLEVVVKHPPAESAEGWVLARSPLRHARSVTLLHPPQYVWRPAVEPYAVQRIQEGIA